MTFYRYMMRQHFGENSSKGDLANDMRSDKESFPKNGCGKYNAWHDIILDYLKKNNACDRCIETFENCWKEYVICEKKK